MLHHWVGATATPPPPSSSLSLLPADSQVAIKDSVGLGAWSQSVIILVTK
jgi:hypothetical protein